MEKSFGCMTKKEFTVFVDKTLDEVKKYAEIHADMTLPDKFKFKWLRDDCKMVVGRENVIHEIISDRIDTDSKDFRNKLIDLGLSHYERE
ncbi:conserved protein of unknown function [Tenacibaculum sp. 190130A14a]|uniref:Uncharacterized protein n=1 Tax=Tenacibaculum polynesiense TaxID=3137857 RepID=A0ABM9PEK2_9FLAO